MNATSASPISCLRCGKTFVSQTKLNQHTEYTHKRAREPDTTTAEGTETAAASDAAQGEEKSTLVREPQSLDDELLSMMADFRITHHMPRALACALKAHMAKLVKGLKAEVIAKVEPHLEMHMDANQILEAVFRTSSDLHVRNSELDRLRAHESYVKPMPRRLGSHPESGEEFYAYDSPVDKTLEAMFATQPEVWQAVKTFAKTFRPRTSDAYNADLKISDIWDGSHFGVFMKVLNCTEGQIPLAFILYYDGLEVVNGIGQARLTHELGCFYWALIPVTQELRLTRDYLRVATVCYKRAISECGMEAVISGGEGSWGKWMDTFKIGAELRTPDGPRFFRGGTALLSADTPAAAECIGSKKAVGPSTKSICRGCHCPQSKKSGLASPHRMQNSFLAGLPGWKELCQDRKQNFRLRTTADMAAYVAKAKQVQEGKLTSSELADWMMEMGLNSFAGSMGGLPYFSVLHGCPMDIMHVFFEGVARQGLGAFAYVLTSKWGVSPYEIGTRLTQYAKQSSHSRQGELPKVNTTRAKHLAEGEKGGLPSKDCSFPGTASQIANLILAVDVALGPLVPPQHKRDPVWQMVLMLCKIGRLLWQRSFTAADILELDKTIWLHDTIVLGTPLLVHLWKPKNHYLSHIPLDILRWGPPRTYWCMPFEHENQLTKGAVTHSNYANVLWSAADHKALCVALSCTQRC